MIERAIHDWDDAYENGKNIADGDQYPSRWQEISARFRHTHAAELDIAYGSSVREKYDLFLPADTERPQPKGLFVFVHGGYWQRTDKSFWSFLAKGPLQAGWAVAMPSYVLCPDACIAEIQTMTINAVHAVADRVDGPLILAGHSAGGHLVQSMMCEDSELSQKVAQRLVHVLSISGIADLRPLLNTQLNEALRLDSASAVKCSPVFRKPMTHVPLTAWVGAAERAEFIRQNALIANIWRGLGATTRVVEEPDRHHFNVIDGLRNKDSPMLRALFL